jgi:hypothetical protein
MYNIAYAVNIVQMDRKDLNTSNIERYSEYALWGYRDLKFKILPGVTSVHVIPNDAMLAPMPPDYVFYTKVSIDICGVSYTLTRNERIPIPQLKCGIEIADICACNGNNLPTVSDFGGQFGYVPHYRAGQFVGEMYSLGGGNNSMGYFRDDETNRQFIFKGVPRYPITIEYVSDGSNGLSQIITAPAVMPIRNYVHWQWKLHSSGKEKATLPEIEMAKVDFFTAKQTLKDITNTPTIDEFCDVMYAGFQSSVKGVAI